MNEERRVNVFRIFCTFSWFAWAFCRCTQCALIDGKTFSLSLNNLVRAESARSDVRWTRINERRHRRKEEIFYVNFMLIENLDFTERRRQHERPNDKKMNKMSSLKRSRHSSFFAFSRLFFRFTFSIRLAFFFDGAEIVAITARTLSCEFSIQQN